MSDFFTRLAKRLIDPGPELLRPATPGRFEAPHELRPMVTEGTPWAPDAPAPRASQPSRPAAAGSAPAPAPRPARQQDQALTDAAGNHQGRGDAGLARPLAGGDEPQPDRDVPVRATPQPDRDVPVRATPQTDTRGEREEVERPEQVEGRAATQEAVVAQQMPTTPAHERPGAATAPEVRRARAAATPDHSRPVGTANDPTGAVAGGDPPAQARATELKLGQDRPARADDPAARGAPVDAPMVAAKVDRSALPEGVRGSVRRASGVPPTGRAMTVPLRSAAAQQRAAPAARPRTTPDVGARIGPGPDTPTRTVAIERRPAVDRTPAPERRPAPDRTPGPDRRPRPDESPVSRRHSRRAPSPDPATPIAAKPAPAPRDGATAAQRRRREAAAQGAAQPAPSPARRNRPVDVTVEIGAIELVSDGPGRRPAAAPVPLSLAEYLQTRSQH